MGFFSWRCAKTHKPIMADLGVGNTEFKELSLVTVLTKNGLVFDATYDGYGRAMPLDSEIVYDTRFTDTWYDITDMHMFENEDEWRMVITKHYDGEKFRDLPKNENEPNQGWFWDDDDLREVMNAPPGSIAY